MFDRILAQLQQQITPKQLQLQQARAEHDSAQAQLAGAVAAAAAAQQLVANANAALAIAQGTVNTAEAARNSAQSARDVAAKALSDHSDPQPDQFLPNGKPNPSYHPWVVKQDQLRDRRDTAQAALNAAQNGLAAAISSRDTSAVALLTAQQQLNAEMGRVSQLQGGMDSTTLAVSRAEAELAGLMQRPGELTARAARILASPLERADVESASDGEMSSAAELRQQRHDLWMHRLKITAARGVAFDAHDATADDLAALAGTIRSWPGTAADPNLAGVAATLEAVVQSSRTNRTWSALTRSNDVASAVPSLSAQVQVIGALVGAAAARRDAAAAALTASSAALAEVNRNAPKR